LPYIANLQSQLLFLKIALSGIADVWENWKEPASGEWISTFAIITTDANELVADIHDRMPAILARSRHA